MEPAGSPARRLKMVLVRHGGTVFFSAGVLFLLSGWIFIYGPRLGFEKKRLLADFSPGDGSELLLLQEYNTITEPYCISLIFRNSGRELWYYIDHESTYWWSPVLFPSGPTVKICNGGSVIAEFDLPSERLVFPDGFARTGVPLPKTGAGP